MLLLQKGTENKLKPACSLIHSQTTAVCIDVNYTFYECFTVRGVGGVSSLILLDVPFFHVFVVLAVSLQKFVPPGEGGGIVSDEVHVVEVMETSASIERNEMQGVPRDVITTEKKNQNLSLL